MYGLQISISLHWAHLYSALSIFHHAIQVPFTPSCCEGWLMTTHSPSFSWESWLPKGSLAQTYKSSAPSIKGALPLWCSLGFPSSLEGSAWSWSPAETTSLLVFPHPVLSCLLTPLLLRPLPQWITCSRILLLLGNPTGDTGEIGQLGVGWPQFQESTVVKRGLKVNFIPLDRAGIAFIHSTRSFVSFLLVFSLLVLLNHSSQSLSQKHLSKFLLTDY